MHPGGKSGSALCCSLLLPNVSRREWKIYAALPPKKRASLPAPRSRDTCGRSQRSPGRSGRAVKYSQIARGNHEPALLTNPPPWRVSHVAGASLFCVVKDTAFPCPYKMGRATNFLAKHPRLNLREHWTI